MPRKKTPQEYYNECKEKGLDLPIENYVNAKTKIKHKCNKCGYIYEQQPSNHLSKQGCPKCKGNYSYTSREYYDLCKEKGLDLPIEDYIGTGIKIKHKCKKGHTYSQRPSDHLRGQGCPICNGNYSYTPQEYYNECKKRNLDLPIENYVNSKIKINHKCSKGHVYNQMPNNHLQGQGCPICKLEKLSLCFKKKSSDYYKECQQKDLDLPIETYINNKTKIKHKCKYGHIYVQSPDMHTGKHKQGCPICKESHGERFIRNYLDSNNIKYEPQKTFKDLKDKTYLSYDFYLPKYKILIEYQGIQHYSEKDYFGGEQQFKTQQYHDKLKKEYAKKNGYKLLELHYSLDTQEKVNKYLERRIKD